MDNKRKHKYKKCIFYREEEKELQTFIKEMDEIEELMHKENKKRKNKVNK